MPETKEQAPVTPELTKQNLSQIGHEALSLTMAQSLDTLRQRQESEGDEVNSSELAQSERTHVLTNAMSERLSQAYDALSQREPEKVVLHDALLKEAVSLQLQETMKAHEAGEATTGELEVYLATLGLYLAELRHARVYIPDDQMTKEVQTAAFDQLVRAGMTEELVEAARNCHGVVINKPKTGIYGEEDDYNSTIELSRLIDTDVISAGLGKKVSVDPQEPALAPMDDYEAKQIIDGLELGRAARVAMIANQKIGGAYSEGPNAVHRRTIAGDHCLRVLAKSQNGFGMERNEVIDALVVLANSDPSLLTQSRQELFDELKQARGIDSDYRVNDYSKMLFDSAINAILEGEGSYGVNDSTKLLARRMNFDDSAARDLIKNGRTDNVLGNLDKFNDLDVQTVNDALEEAIKNNLFDSIDSALYHLPVEVIDQQRIRGALIQYDMLHTIGRNPQMFKDLDEAMAIAFIRQGYGENLIKHKEAFQPFTEGVIMAAIDRDLPDLYGVYKQSGLKIEWLDKAFVVLGETAPSELIIAVKDLLESEGGQLPAYLQEVGVTMSGQAGIEQLNSISVNIRRRFLAHESGEDLHELVNLLVTNKLARMEAMRLTRFKESQYGGRDLQSWSEPLLSAAEADPDARMLSLGFLASESVIIHSLNAKEFDPTRIDQDAQERFSFLLKDVNRALDIATDPQDHRYSFLFEEAGKMMREELDRLNLKKQELAINGNEKALQNVETQINLIQDTLELNAVELIRMLQSDFQSLARLKIKGMDSLIRSVAFARAIRKSPQARELAISLQGSRPSVDSFSKMDDLLQHLINGEVYQNFFRSQDAAKAFEKLTDTYSLRLQISKLQKGEASGQTTIQFIPSRGLMLELSGHIGDACWANKSGNIASQNPNLSAITFLRNPGQSTERLVGSCLVIDTIDENTGEPTLVIRGINPIENYINTVRVNEFVDALVGYAKQIAGGRKVAVVIDPRGHASTNRPVVADYLGGEFKDRSVIGAPLNLPEDSTFNGYELSAEARHPAYVIA